MGGRGRRGEEVGSPSFALGRKKKTGRVWPVIADFGTNRTVAEIDPGELHRYFWAEQFLGADSLWCQLASFWLSASAWRIDEHICMYTDIPMARRWGQIWSVPSWCLYIHSSFCLLYSALQILFCYFNLFCLLCVALVNQQPNVSTC